MNRAVLILCLAALTLTTSSPAQRRLNQSRGAAVQTWLPLTTGNYWIYERQGDSSSTGYRMEVGEPITRNGRTYFQLENPFGPSALVRRADDGRFVAWNPDTGTDAVWYDFGAAEGTSWSAEGRTCLAQGRIVGRGLDVDSPAGSFSGALKVELRGPCADAGSTDEVFVPGVGMVEHEEITIAGPQRFLLREVRVDGKTIASAPPALSFGIALDKPVYTPNLMPPVDPGRAVPTLRAVVRLENTSGQPLRLDFPSGQQFEAQVMGPSGEVLYTWSATRLFIQAATAMELDGGFQEFVIETPLGNADKMEPWLAGRYLVRAWLPTTAEPRHTVQAPFEITEPAH